MFGEATSVDVQSFVFEEYGKAVQRVYAPPTVHTDEVALFSRLSEGLLSSVFITHHSRRRGAEQPTRANAHVRALNTNTKILRFAVHVRQDATRRARTAEAGAGSRRGTCGCAACSFLRDGNTALRSFTYQHDRTRGAWGWGAHHATIAHIQYAAWRRTATRTTTTHEGTWGVRDSAECTYRQLKMAESMPIPRPMVQRVYKNASPEGLASGHAARR